MFRHFLVPLDGSKMAEAALPTVISLSKKFDSLVTLFHVVEKNAPSEVHGQKHLEDPDQARNYLRDTAREVFTDNDRVDFHVHTTEADNVAESVIAHAEELNCDVIVMCSHGRGKALHLLLGSIAEKVISKGSLPVFVTRPDKEGSVPPFSCRSLLLPLDGDPDHEQAIPMSKDLAKAFESVLNLIMVIPSFGVLSGEEAATSRFLPGTTSRILEISAQKADEYLQGHLKQLRSLGIQANANVVRGDPGASIADSAGHLGVDLIVLATHGKSGMQAFWEGSVAHKVSSLSRVPMLLIPVKKG